LDPVATGCDLTELMFCVFRDRNAIRGLLSFDTTKLQYTLGAADPNALAPETWWLDWSLMNNTAGNADYQLDLFYDYRTNVAQYPQYQEYLRKSQVPLIAVWGKSDIMYEIIPPHITRILFKTYVDNSQLCARRSPTF